MGNRKSLGRLITKYAILEIVYTFFVFLFFLINITLLIRKGYIYPANYAEMNISKVEESLKNPDFNPKSIPYYFDYKYTKNGEVLANTIDTKYKNYVEQTEKTGFTNTNLPFNNKYFKKLARDDKTLILAYQISPILASERAYNKVKNVELLYISLAFIIWFLGFTLLIRKSIKIIKNEIEKISKTNQQIKNMDLDFKSEDSKYTEIAGVLDSLDAMAIDLKKSLHDQWQIEQRQKNLIESITHDIRTPITLIKGNTELLKEEGNPDQLEYINDIETGIDRLNIYIEKLTNFSKNIANNPQKVDENAINYWINIAKSICKNANINLIVTKSEPSTIKLDREQIAVAIQNIIVNSTEHSPKNSNIYLTFENQKNYFQIIIKDQGPGFKKEIFDKIPQKNLTTKTDKIKHGMGLVMVDEILKSNKGRLNLGNYQKDSKSGAIVKIIFYK
ncbi:HAMP domain-containing sensor histidine kinase [uncultured Anaerococcus sp.]|uniref:sensor histidine kinase n=1 Tax=uncultured Anaerococcus sp. TaxID=293428 RepID=UPI0025F63D64|nr:HAMP domain-containing sensor histidine kinase [uncultured Anaerococcus sp.]